MKQILFAFAIFTNVACFTLSQFHGETGSDRSDRPEQTGPAAPGEPAWTLTKNARGPTGRAEDPNPRPDREPQGIIISLHTSEPNGPDGPMTGSGDKGPRGMSSEYYAALTNDHYAGPDCGLD